VSSVLDPPRSPSVRNPRPVALFVAGAIAVVVALVFVAQQLTPSKSFVSRITVVNPTPYHLEIDVIGAGRQVGVGLGPIRREQTKDFEDVIDQGREWIFRFHSGGTDGGEARIPRTRLEQDRWRLTVPPEVAQRLQSAGVRPSPAGE
jgi:hypothetical protein